MDYPQDQVILMTPTKIYNTFGIDSVPMWNMKFKVLAKQFPQIGITQVDIWYPWGEMLTSEEVDSKNVDWR